MDAQQVANALLLVPAAAFGVVAVRARRAGRTRLGLGVRGGALAEAGAGLGFGAVSLAALSLVLWMLGLGPYGAAGWDPGPLVGIGLYFLALFLVEEVVFRSLLMTGLGVLTGRAAALALVSVLVAVPYLFADGSGPLPMVGAVLTNVLTGLTRWRTGRIWFGVGMRWIWNTGQVALGYTVSGYTLGGTPLLDQHLNGPTWATGSSYGPEGGLVGITVRAAQIAALLALTMHYRRTWRIEPSHQDPHGR